MKINKSVYVMFCICMFFCGCMITTTSTTSSTTSTTSTTQSFVNVQQKVSTTPSLVSVQRKDNSEPLKLGTIVYNSHRLTKFCVTQVLNNQLVELDHDDTNIWYVSQMVLAHAYDERLWLDNRCMSAWIIPSEGYVYANGQAIAKGYYMYLGNYTYETVDKNPNGSPKYNTLRVFHEVDAPTDITK